MLHIKYSNEIKKIFGDLGDYTMEVRLMKNKVNKYGRTEKSVVIAYGKSI